MRLYSALAAFTLGMSVVCARPAGGQEIAASTMDVLRDQLDIDKRTVVEKNLVLSESEAKSFWPIYEEYQRELEGIDRRIVELVNKYAEEYANHSVTDAEARRLIVAATALDEAEVELRKKTIAKLSGVVPAIEAARYLQIENKIRAVVRFDLADRIPLVE